MARQLISSGGKWEEILGYSRAVVDGEWVFLAGTGGLGSRLFSNSGIGSPRASC